MGSACCVAARDKSLLPNRTSSEGLSRNVRYSPAWNCRWDSQGRVADEVENPPSVYSHGTSENVECGDLSERQSQPDSQTPILEKSPIREVATVKSTCSASGKLYGRVDSTLRKSPIREEAALKTMSSASEPSMGSSSFNEVKDMIEPSAVASPSALRLSFSLPLTSSCSKSNVDLSSHRHLLPADSTPSWQARHHSPGYHFLRQVSDVRLSDLKSPNNSISEGRPSLVLSTGSNDLTVGSQGGGSSDGWSMSTFSELVASSQRERWSFDSENLDNARGKVTRSNSSVLASPSIDLRTCGVCLKLLMEKSPWVAQKIIVSNELSVVAVLVCGHVYHAECLENTTPEAYRFDPPCPVCTTGDKRALKFYGRTVKVDTDSKVRNRISRNRVVDSNLDVKCAVSDQWRSARREGKGPMLGSSSSMKSSFAKPFLKRHFSLGSKSTKSILENEFSIKSPTRKGFWSRYRKG